LVDNGGAWKGPSPERKSLYEKIEESTNIIQCIVLCGNNHTILYGEDAHLPPPPPPLLRRELWEFLRLFIELANYLRSLSKNKTKIKGSDRTSCITG